MDTTTLNITPADPRAAEGRALVAELDAYLATLYDDQENHLTPVEDLAGPQARFWLARLDGIPVGCAALRLFPDYGEVKRFYVRPELRGRGVAKQLLDAVEAEAHRLGLPVLKLETGPAQMAAVALYGSRGFTICGPFGNYPSCGGSLFMEKRLGA